MTKKHPVNRSLRALHPEIQALLQISEPECSIVLPPTSTRTPIMHPLREINFTHYFVERADVPTNNNPDVALTFGLLDTTGNDTYQARVVLQQRTEAHSGRGITFTRLGGLFVPALVDVGYGTLAEGVTEQTHTSTLLPDGPMGRVEARRAAATIETIFETMGREGLQTNLERMAPKVTPATIS